MKQQTPISLEEAIALMEIHEKAAQASGRTGADRGQTFWFSFNFVEFISDLGYHIEITGDEFEAYTLSDKFS